MGSNPFPTRGAKLNSAADTPAAIWHPSPNFGIRRDGLTPSLIVIHYTAMDSAAAALQRLCDPSVEVSAHYLIGGDGTCWQMVAEDQRAWHAGAGQWCGQDDINSRSIGIELDNRGGHPFAEPQMAALEGLLAGIMHRWSIPADAVIGHSDMAPGRKIDPGPKFDWKRLARLGLCVWPAETAGQATELGWWHDYADSFGYPIFGFGLDGVEDMEAASFQAFRDRFRPQARNIKHIENEDLRIIENLANQEFSKF